VEDGGGDVVSRAVLLCRESGAHWYDGVEAPKCTDEGHDHPRFELHVHRTVVTLPDGTRVTAVSFDPADPYGRAHTPDHGLYLDPMWQPPWPHVHVDWPDFGVPADATGVMVALGDLIERAQRGERVEVGCHGGHGRTGTALACLAVLAGERPADAVAWVRANYCSQAVETPEQEAFVAGLSPAP
jgi:hypothetical protein